MKPENRTSAYRLECPEITFREKMSLIGFAKYMGYEFDYDPDKNKAVLIKHTDQGRKVLFIQRINDVLCGVDKEGNIENIREQANLSRLLFNAGIFQLPPKIDFDVNEYMKSNLKLLKLISI